MGKTTTKLCDDITDASNTVNSMIPRIEGYLGDMTKAMSKMLRGAAEVRKHLTPVNIKFLQESTGGNNMTEWVKIDPELEKLVDVVDKAKEEKDKAKMSLQGFRQQFKTERTKLQTAVDALDKYITKKKKSKNPFKSKKSLPGAEDSLKKARSGIEFLDELETAWDNNKTLL